MPDTPTPTHLYIVQWHGQMNAINPYEAALDALAGMRDVAVAMKTQYVVIGITGPDRGKQFHCDMLTGTTKELDQPAKQFDPQEAGLIELDPN